MQNIIRKNLLSALNDPQGKICTAVSMAVASIAFYDWPTDWPDLLPFLLNLISDHSNMSGGEVRCHNLIYFLNPLENIQYFWFYKISICARGLCWGC